MQRKVLPDLIEAFSRAHFIVSKHSPLVVGSVRDANIFILDYNERKKIFARELDLQNKAKTASSILHNVLGLSFTMPLLAENELTRITNKYYLEYNLLD